MRHKRAGRQLGRNASHRRSMFRNMACSLITSVVPAGAEPGTAKVSGRIETTVEKAKELRPVVEKLVTLAKRSLVHVEAAEQFATSAVRNTPEWKEWRKSDRWQQWNRAIAPAVALRRRAFAALRSQTAVNTLFSELGPKFRSRPGGYTRIVRLARVRLGDGGKLAIIEFVGDRDRTKTRRPAAIKVEQ
ncbi:MAG: 50S ribosomal protein L17 [Planctomycetes bacterium]|nr:50S ribosomal protein L17 [Planctomycetota bacterium]